MEAFKRYKKNININFFISNTKNFFKSKHVLNKNQSKKRKLKKLRIKKR